MISEADLTDYAYIVSARFDAINTHYIKLMAKQIKEIGKLSPSNLFRLQQMSKMQQNIDSIEYMLAQETGKTLDELDKVLELRKILENVSNKIIPVWHKNRGIEEFKKMCQDYSERVIAITGFKNEDIKDEQYLMFLKYAKKYNCKVHCLGMTRKKVLDKVPFDYVDSSSWKQSGIYGRIDGRGKVSKQFSKVKREIVFMENYKVGIKMQNHYYKKWRHICKD